MARIAATLILAASLASTGFAAELAASQKHLSFREDVAPILVRKCLGCHNAKKPANGLDMTTFATLKRGGKSEGAAIITPDDPDSSGLVESVTADAAPRMPYKLPPLPDSEITTLTRWVKEGARFDGPSEIQTPIASLVDPLKGLPKVAAKSPATDPATAVAFSSDGTLLATSIGRSVILYDLASGKPRSTWPDHPGPISTLRFADQGRLLIAVGGRPSQFGSITAWDLAKGVKKFEVQVPGDTFLAADVSPDGTTLATTSYNRQVLIWDIAKGSRVKELKDHTDAVHGVAFSPDGKLLATCGADRTVKVWDWRKGTKLVTLSDATAELYDVVFSPDSKRILASGVDRSIRIWSATDKEFPLIRSVFAHDAAVIRLAIAPRSNLLATCSEDRTIKLWDLATMNAKSVVSAQSDWVQGLGFSPDGHRLAVGRHDGSVELLDTTSGKSVLALRESPKKPTDNPTLTRNPTLGPPQPRGGVRGTKLRLILNGEGVGQATSILAPAGGLSASILPASKPDQNRLELDLAIAADARPGIHRFTTVGPAGIPADQPFDVSPFPETQEMEPNENAASATKVGLPSTITGAIGQPGDFDHFVFEAKAGRRIIFEVIAKPLGSMIRPVVSVLDGAGHTVATVGPTDDTSDPVLIFSPPRDGAYVLAIADADYGGSANHFYRIRAGEIPWVDSVFPRGVERGQTAKIKVEGVNLNGLTESTFPISIESVAGTILPVPIPEIAGSLTPLKPGRVVVAEGPQVIEVEPNDQRNQAQALADNSGVSGRIGTSGDVDIFRFNTKKGERRILEVYGRRLGTPVDPVLEILALDGKPVPRAVLRLVDKTEVAFRDHPSKGTGIRLTHWNNLEVNDFVLVGRELMRVFALPRNPDDDCQFYGEDGQRLGMFETTPEHHPMSQPMYKVEIHPPGSQFPAGGNAPVVLTYRNDDGGPRFGKDSRITFDPPADGEYLLRVGDVRGSGGPDFAYHLVIHPPLPDYRLTSSATNLNIPRGGTRLLPVTLSRIDGFDRPVDVWADGLPPGIRSTGTRILPNELAGMISFTADDSAPSFSPPSWKLYARPVGEETGETVASVGEGRAIDMGDPSGGRITVTREPNLGVHADPGRIVIQPGQEVTMKIKVDRGSAFSGRVPVLVQNLPQGVRVLNIGLNGVLITEKQTERTVVIRAESWVKPMVRPFFAVGKAESAGTEDSSPPIMLEVVKPARLSQSR